MTTPESPTSTPPASLELHGDALPRFTEEHQENVFQHQVKMLNRIPPARHSSLGADDFGSPPQFARHQDYFNIQGPISVRGEKKKAFVVMQEFYRGSNLT